MGDLTRRHGESARASGFYRQGADLLAALPASTVVQRRMAVLEGKLGAVDSAQALPHYQRELEQWTALLKASPDDATLLASQAIAHGHVASKSPPAEALPHAQSQADAFAKLTLLDSLNAAWQRQHATAVHQLGVALEATGNTDDAMKSYRQDVELTSKLPNAERDQAAAHLRLAALLFRTKSEAEAKAHAQQTLALLANSNDAEANAWRATALELAK